MGRGRHFQYFRVNYCPESFSFAGVKILVIRFSSIGDIVLTSPVLRCLKNQIPGAEIHFLTKKRFAGLLEHNPHITKIVAADKVLRHTIAELRQENYDVVIDLHHNLRSLRVKMMLFKPSFSFDKLNIKKWLWVNLKMDRMPDIHIVQRYLETTKSLGVKDDGQGLEFYPCDCDLPDAEEFPEEIKGSPYVVLSIGGTHFTKKMPVSKWIELGKKIPLPMVIVGGKEDMENGWQLSENLKKLGKKIWNAAGLFSIGGSAHLIRQSALVLSHDTGMMHIAAAFQKPIVAIWGNTSPKLGMAPFRTAHFNMEVNGLSCRPCSKIGYNSCPRNHFDCMQKQDIQSADLQKFIQEAIENYLTAG